MVATRTSVLGAWQLALVAAALLGGTAGWSGYESALATPLDAAECQKLKAEQAELTKDGVRDQYAKGPSWARANLSSDAMARISRLITLDEQIEFRCPHPPRPKAAVAATDETGVPVKPKAKPKIAAAKPAAAEEAGEAAPKPKPKPKPKAPAAESGAAPAPVAPAKAAAPKAPAAKVPVPAKAARAKSDDAFRPEVGTAQ